ncbi:probably inactive leucine-rich repeat receptor-like protein kinase At5g48380 [Brassica rapa]|uniref:Leucine-rich repeat-containing N-terminal plant-type domain-containing protein n=1 Tax=Brassica campestris TaxID=3711 RepID=M4CAM6_BRACM|nr:probably inactive leucine-rich repeat receptor-like protein kinase At5g48380 [Brassica rapa]
MMMVAKLVCTIFIRSCLWLLLLPGLTRAMESDITCLRSLKSQLKDPHAYLSNWVFGDYSDGYICSFFGMYCYRSSLNKVLSINLGGSGLEGEFPSGVKLCSFMESLNLTGNNLTGTLPSDTFSSLPFLVTLDLSNNNLAGEIPASLPNMSYLNTLLLDHNRFTGRIPSELASSPGLLQFSVAHNDLKGPIPEFTAGNISLSSFDDNPDLCGFPLDPCQDSFYSMAIIAANIAAAAFFPVGACYGWLYDSHKQNQRPRRR